MSEAVAVVIQTYLSVVGNIASLRVAQHTGSTYTGGTLRGISNRAGELIQSWTGEITRGKSSLCSSQNTKFALPNRISRSADNLYYVSLAQATPFPLRP